MRVQVQFPDFLKFPGFWRFQTSDPGPRMYLASCITFCPWREGMLVKWSKRYYHLVSLRGSDIIKPCWFLELREVCDGFPKIPIFIQTTIWSQAWPSTFRSSSLQTSCNSKHSKTDTMVSKNFEFIIITHLCILVPAHQRAIGIYLIFPNTEYQNEVILKAFFFLENFSISLSLVN